MAVRYGAITPEVDAVRWTGDNIEEVLAFTDAVMHVPLLGHIGIRVGGECEWDDIEPVDVGSWIVRKPGEGRHYWPFHWPMSDDVFTELYEEAS